MCLLILSAFHFQAWTLNVIVYCRGVRLQPWREGRCVCGMFQVSFQSPVGTGVWSRQNPVLENGTGLFLN